MFLDAGNEDGRGLWPESEVYSPNDKPHELPIRLCLAFRAQRLGFKGLGFKLSLAQF